MERFITDAFHCIFSSSYAHFLNFQYEMFIAQKLFLFDITKRNRSVEYLIRQLIAVSRTRFPMKYVVFLT